MKNDSELIKKNLFVGERGFIVWGVHVNLIWAEDTKREPKDIGIGVGLYYRVEDENIFLYNSFYNFHNDIRN